MNKLFNINTAMILVGFISIPIGLFCASEMYWQTMGHGTFGGYLLALMGAVMLAMGVSEVSRGRTF